MRKRLALLVAPLLLLALLPGATTAAGPKANPQAQSRAEVLAYWTPERIASAKPIELRKGGASPQAKPGPGGGGGGVTNTTGASWPSTDLDPITRATGKVFFSMGGGNWVCSGSVIDDTRAGYSLVLTAGHCVVDAETGEFATNWLFVPAYDRNPASTCASLLIGCWSSVALVARSEFINAGGFTNEAVRHDWAFAVVGGGGKQAGSNQQLDTAVGGAFGLDTTSGIGETMTALGYPAAGKYRGKDLVYCQGTVATDPGTGGSTYSMPCAMTGGSSGGPWLMNASAGFGAEARSLNSYGYEGVRNMYGPIFNAETAKTFAVANGTESGDVPVSGQ